jgi:hypothetical protein
MAANLFGFNPSEFVPTAWELIPYSFLADYFTNIGDILDSWAYGRGNLSWSNRTQIQETNNSYFGPVKLEPFLSYATVQQYISAPPAVFTHRKISRASYLGNFVPQFQTEIPGMSTKWINLAALLASKRMSPYY